MFLDLVERDEDEAEENRQHVFESRGEILRDGGEIGAVEYGQHDDRYVAVEAEGPGWSCTGRCA